MAGFNSLNKGSSITAGGVPLPIGPFGTLEVSEATPGNQSTFIYGLNQSIWVTSSLGSGAGVTVSEGIVTCSSGISSTGRAVVQFKRGLQYRAGQGGSCKITAIFDPGVAGSRQIAGVGNTECGYYFSRTNTNFGITHTESGQREIRKLTITAAGSTENVTITLNGVSTTINIAAGSNINQASYQISKGDFTQAFPGWVAEAIDGTVYFSAQSAGPLTGSYEITGGVTSGSFSRVEAGVSPVSTFISQSQWNIDRFDGTGESRVTLNPGKGNVYGIGYQYLGFGDAIFSIEDPNKGVLVPVHRIINANSRNKVVLSNPYVAARWGAVNVGSTTNVSIKGGSAAQFVEGKIVRNIGPSFATGSVKASVGTSLVPLLTIRTNRVFKDTSSYGLIDPFNISIGHDTGSAASIALLQVFVYQNAGLQGRVNYQYVDQNNSFAAADYEATGSIINPNTSLRKNFIVGPNDSLTINLKDENFALSNGETLTIAAKTTKGTSDVACSLSWFEDQ